MEEFKNWIFSGLIVLLGIVGKYLFNKQDTRIENLERQVNANKQDIALNTQSDKEYRANTSATLLRLEKKLDKVLGID